MSEQPTPEQVKEFQEKLKDMSPEEIKELQKQQCIFCQIIDEKVSSKKIYEDDKCLAILDINPANPGHALLMPKEHFPLMPLIPENILGHMFMVAKALSKVMLTAVNAEGTDIFIANGSAAGQRAQHFMFHIIPRRSGDELPLDIPFKEVDEKELKKISAELKNKINAVLKIKTEVVQEKPTEEKTTKEKKPVKEAVKNKSPEKPVKKSTKKKITKKPVKEEKQGADLDDIASLFS